MVGNGNSTENATEFRRARKEFIICDQCSTDCQLESQEPKDLPDEQEIKRRASIVRDLTLAGVKITKARLDWYD